MPPKATQMDVKKAVSSFTSVCIPMIQDTEEPLAKKQKADAEVEEATEDQVKVEMEVDAGRDDRLRLKDQIRFDTADLTLNVVPTSGGLVLMSLTDGGIQYLIAGARANVGVKAGRYFFEVRVIECLNPPEGPIPGRVMGPQPRQLLRVGFSGASSPLVVAEGDAGAFYFDSEGMFYDAVKRRPDISVKFGHDAVVAVVLNLEAATVSLFCDGVRASEPLPLPPSLQGVELFPYVAFRNLTVQANFGTEALKPLPFKCRMLQDAASADVIVRQDTKDSKHEVLFPVGFPDEGTFDWLDGFLDEHPQYVELSDRKILEWAVRSGLGSAQPGGDWMLKPSRDKPAFNFGVPMMDDMSVRTTISIAAAVVPRDYVVMEVKQNLVAGDRNELKKRFPKHLFRRVVRVMMGEPSSSFRKLVKDKILKSKLQKAEQIRQAKIFEENRKKFIEAKRKVQDEKKQAGAENASVEKAADDEAIEISLTQEEENQRFVKSSVPDLLSTVLEKSYPSFSIPEADEGFDAIEFEWEGEAECKEYLRKWILDRKRTSRIEDVQPGEWFRTKQIEWAKQVQDWQARWTKSKSTSRSVRKSDDDEEEQQKGLVDIHEVVDVCDVGNGEPLFQDFKAEDWTLMTLRWQMFTLAEGYRRDVDDVDRSQIPYQHVGFYFHRYFKAQLSPSFYGVETYVQLLRLIKDTALISESGFLAVGLQADAAETPALFVKLTEDARRDRRRRLAAGDESARLRLGGSLAPAPAVVPPVVPAVTAVPPPPPPLPPVAGGLPTVVVPPSQAWKGKGKGKSGCGKY